MILSKRLLLILVLTSAHAFLPAWGIEVQLADGSIAAKPVYHGDYYFSPTGEQVKVYRKEGVFALPFDAAEVSGASDLAKRAKQSGIQSSEVTKHNLPGAKVLKVKTTRAKVAGSEDFISSRLKAQNPQMLPVFTSERGLGDLLLLSKVTISFDVAFDLEDSIRILTEQHALQMERRLSLSGQVYSFTTPNYSSPSDLFSLVRRLAKQAGVNWVEPQFFMQANKSAFSPSDEFYQQQWNLQNRGYRGSRCDADCDAVNAWRIDSGAGAATGAGTVIAIIDDGVQLDHPDLNIEPGGKDFVDDTSTVCGDDGNAGPDNNASPSPVVGCVVAGDSIDADNHGTAVAGVAAAKQGNGGVVGAAFSASVLPIRAISEYEVASVSSSALCNRLAEAVEYAAQRADVINLSWNLPVGCSALSQAIERTTNGSVTVGTGSRRALGSPVVVSSGNNASGWVKVTAEVESGEHAYEWRYLRSDTPSTDIAGIDETVWLDDITWSDGTVENFESLNTLDGVSGFSTDWVLNSCNAECTFNFGDEPVWGINTNSLVNYAHSGSKAASLNIENSDCGNSYLHTIKEGPEGEVSFWVWVSADTQESFDRFEFLVDGQEVVSYGDLAAFGFVDNPVGYPANLSNAVTSSEQGVIAVGASTSGDLSGETGVLRSAEARVAYSQYGPTLDIVAPSSDQHLGVTTTDRISSSGSDSLGYNTGSTDDDISSNRAYTENFGGTSASAALVSGVAAAMIAKNPSLSAQRVKEILKETADKIGTDSFVAATPSTRNDQVGSGRLNMYNAVRVASGTTASTVSSECAAQPFDYQVADDRILSRFQPQALAGQCPALGTIPERPEDEDCSFIVIKTKNGRGAVLCF
ncbi:hypothetical protein NBRC116583_02230 [Arenicella sp. 4NH20-0111]|uniref:S8 family serine peptidase n=1 Tax=Arenicella sp. 4NH20-0111 TaxID=3127648 RepID=UPI00310693BF